MMDAVQDVRSPLSVTNTQYLDGLQETEGLQANQLCFQHLLHLACLFHPRILVSQSQMLTFFFAFDVVSIKHLGNIILEWTKQCLIFKMIPWHLKLEQQTGIFLP